MYLYLIAFLCVLGQTVGQLLLKFSAEALLRTGTIFDFKVLVTLVPALSLYGFMTLLWVWLLQKIELGRVYPIMAFAFILVPLGSHFLLSEKFSSQYFLGVVLIMVGIIVAVKA